MFFEEPLAVGQGTVTVILMVSKIHQILSLFLILCELFCDYQILCDISDSTFMPVHKVNKMSYEVHSKFSGLIRNNDIL